MGCFNVIDDLVYEYEGNQLISLVDNAPAATKDLGFKPDNFANNRYTYDNNGNLRVDPNRAALFDLYNHLNLCTSYVKYGEGYLEWDYDANGTKLQKRTFGNPSVSATNLPSKNNFATLIANETRDYVNGIEYVNNELEAIYHEQGRIIKKNGNFEWQWSLSDHLGNTRVLFSDTDNDGSIDGPTEVLQTTDYYPFGMSWEGNTETTPEHRYLYNGKELDTDFGLDWYHYGFRMYDPAIARFTGVDPISDKFPHVSTYNYAENRPVNGIDLHGLQFFPASQLVQDNLTATPHQKAAKRAVAQAAGEFAASFTPAGIALDVRDADQAISQRDGTGFVFAMIGLVPGGGDLAKGLLKRVREIWQNLDLHSVAKNNTRIGGGITEEGESSDARDQVKAQLKEGENFMGSNSQTAHVEDNLIDGTELQNKNLIHIDVSHDICLDCEKRIKSRNISTNTPFSGKQSKKRAANNKNKGKLFDN